MKKLGYSFTVLFAIAVIFNSCDPSNVSEQEDISITANNNYFQKDGGEKYYVTNAKLEGTLATVSTDVSKYVLTLESTDVLNNVRTTKIAFNFPFGKTISGTYNLVVPDRILDKNLSNYKQIEASVVSGPYSNLIAGALVIENTTANNYKITFSMQPSGYSVITGKYTGTIAN